MRYLKQTILVLTLFLRCVEMQAQPSAYSAGNAHSHNDYLSSEPFYLAFKNGYGSIEADIFAVEGTLLVAHSKKELKQELTLKRLYLDPLFKELSADNKRKLILLIDIKEDHELVLPLLIKELEPLSPFLSTAGNPNCLTIVISGNRPAPINYKTYPEIIFFDDDLKVPHSADQWDRVALVSLPFSKVSKWKGEGPMAPSDMQAVKRIIDSVHTAGKPIRFWAAPDTKASWENQITLNVDLIGTDKIAELTNFIRKRRSD